MSRTESLHIQELKRQLKQRIDVSSKFEINIHRSNILNDSILQFQNTNLNNFLKQLYIFIIEDDEKTTEVTVTEWINLIAAEIFNTQYDLFIHSENNKYFPSTKSSINVNHLDYFRFSGLIVALSIIYDASIYITFSSFFLKHILHLPIILEDLIDYDSCIYESYKFMEKNDVENIQIFFETIINYADGPKSIELIPNGSNIKISNENKYDYFKLMTNLLLTKSISDQTKSFCEIFDQIIPHEFFENITPDELNRIIFGTTQININFLKNNIKIEEPYTSETPVIKYFFDIISTWSNDDLQKLLIFVTGYSHIVKDETLFTICIVEGPRALPISHTLIKKLMLPEYESKEELSDKLSAAIQFTSIMMDD